MSYVKIERFIRLEEAKQAEYLDCLVWGKGRRLTAEVVMFEGNNFLFFFKEKKGDVSPLNRFILK